MIGQRKRASVSERGDIPHGIRAVQRKGRKCSSCSMYGHFAVCYRKLARTAPETGRGLRPKISIGNRKAFRRQTNQVEDFVAGQKIRKPCLCINCYGRK